MLEAPRNADEHFFALDRKRKSIRKHAPASTRLKLRSAESVEVPARFRSQPEQGVIHVLSAKGFRCIHAENEIWRTLFGLLFWQLLFDGSDGHLHNPFQSVRSDLRTPTFAAQKADAIEDALRLLDDERAFFDHIERIYYDHYRTVQAFVSWQPNTLQLLAQCFRLVGGSKLQAVLREVTRNPRNNLSGFPDLFVYNDTHYRFVEVKSPNDQLSPQQLHWLLFFEEVEIEAAVLKVRWSEKRRGR